MPAVPLTITSLRGGLNEAAPVSLADDQCVIAKNIEWVLSPLGERRYGCIGINLTGSPFEAGAAIYWQFRHLPTTNLADAQFWAWGFNPVAQAWVLAYKDTSWHTVSVPDGIGGDIYDISAVSLHGKLFLAYKSGIDRLHVWDSGATALRRTGLLGVTTAPGVVGFGSGTFGNTRYYRVRFVRILSGSIPVVRSEPTLVTTFTPPGTQQGATITRPAPPNDGETHWELEASVDNANFYRMATAPLAVTSLNDLTAYATGYATQYPLADDIGDYTPIPSVRFLAVDEDRLVGAGSYMDPALASRVLWTPVWGGTGVGNDERVALDTNPSLDLDNYDGGDITALSSNVNGYLYATKLTHIYQLARTGIRTRAYEAIPLTKKRGALRSSLVEGFNQSGRPFLFALDPDVGPIHIGGAQGIAPCGLDLLVTWPTVNLDAALVARSVYYPESQQVHWWVATSGANTPNLRLVLHTNLMRITDEGSRGGFAVWDGPSASILSVCLFSDNIDTGGPRSLLLKPFIGTAGGGRILKTDTGNSDHGTAYYATVKTKPFSRGGLLDHFEVGEAEMMAKQASGAQLDVIATGMRSNKSLVTKTVPSIDLTPLGGEGVRIIRKLDNLGLAECQTIQFEVGDTVDGTPGPRWELELLSVTVTPGQKARD